MPLGRQSVTAPAAKGDDVEGSASLGFDPGEYETKLLLTADGQRHQLVVASRGRSVEDVLTAAVAQIRQQVPALSRIPVLGLATALDPAAAKSFRGLLRQTFPHIELAEADLDPRAVAWYALERPPKGTLWNLDVGWREVRLATVTQTNGGPRVESFEKVAEYHGQLIDQGFLNTLKEYNQVDDVAAAYRDVEGPDYSEAVRLKLELSTQKVVSIAGASVRGRTVRRDLLATAWRNYPQGLVDEPLRQRMAQAGGSLLFTGASCRLPLLRKHLSDKLPKELEQLAPPGDDPGFVRAFGLQRLAADAARELLASRAPTSLEPPELETPVLETPILEKPVLETPALQTPVLETPVLETPGIASPAVDEPPEMLDTKRIARLSLRLAGELQPLFDVVDGQAHPRQINCQPIPEALHRDGAAEIELQCFLASTTDLRDPRGCPRYLGGRSLPVPTNGDGFQLSFRLLRQGPLRLRVRVQTRDAKLFDKEIDWHVEETADDN